jgi:LysM domain
LLGGLATYFGAHTGAAIAQPSPAASFLAGSAVERPAAFVTAEHGSPYANQTGDKARFFTYTVQPHDTLSNLCEWAMGRYDEAALAELRKLNPDLIDPDRIEVGEQIRLPVRHSN